MSEEVNGGAAFPTIDGLSEDPNFGGNFTTYGDDGMTLRDYFAAKALPIAMSTPWRDIGYVPADSLYDMRQHARCAYQMADAMLAERAK